MEALNTVCVLAALLHLHPDPNDVSLGDLARFPPRWLAEREQKFAVEHLKYLELRIRAPLISEEEYTLVAEWMREAKRCEEIWSYLIDAQRKQYVDWNRLHNLRELRRAIGETAYRGGVMPPPAPVWRFRRCESR